MTTFGPPFADVGILSSTVVPTGGFSASSGEVETDLRASIGDVAGGNRSTVCLYEVLHDGQTQAGSRSGPSLLRTVEVPEDMG